MIYKSNNLGIKRYNLYILAFTELTFCEISCICTYRDDS